MGGGGISRADVDTLVGAAGLANIGCSLADTEPVIAWLDGGGISDFGDRSSCRVEGLVRERDRRSLPPSS